jgi:hypothetical protein
MATPPPMPPVGQPECLDNPGPDMGLEERCSGPVEYRMPLSPSGKPFPRCERHWADRLDRQEQINARYPDSPFPPPGFDPAYAGEHWDYDY